MKAKDYFESVKAAKMEYNNALMIRLYGRPHQIIIGRSSDISDPTVRQYEELAEADAIIEYCYPLISEAELVIQGLRVVMTTTSKIADVLHMRYLDLLPPHDIKKALAITSRREAYLCNLGFKLFDNLGKAFLVTKGKTSM